jgi:large subunit ribosomal protein L33
MTRSAVQSRLLAQQNVSNNIKNKLMATKKPFLKMQCTVCKKTNYFTKKTKKTAEKKLELSKFCNTCKKHTLHKEGRK